MGTLLKLGKKMGRRAVNPINACLKPEGIERLVKRGESVDASYDYIPPLVYFAGKGAEPMVRKLLLLGGDPNVTYSGPRNPDILRGTTALMSVVSHRQGADHKKIVKLLLKHGADVNRTEEQGRSAVWYAAYHQRREALELFLKAGAILPQDVLAAPVCLGN